MGWRRLLKIPQDRGESPGIDGSLSLCIFNINVTPGANRTQCGIEAILVFISEFDRIKSPLITDFRWSKLGWCSSWYFGLNWLHIGEQMCPINPGKSLQRK